MTATLPLKKTIAAIIRNRRAVSKAVFKIVTDPGEADPVLDSFGLDLAQTMPDHQIYHLNGWNGRVITPLSIAIINNGRGMIVFALWRKPITTEYTKFDYERIFALVNEAHQVYSDAEFPEVSDLYSHQEEDDYGLGPMGRV